VLWSSRDNVFSNNSICGNTAWGINATGNNGFAVNETHNWWGDPSGPYHPERNPRGKGDNVTDHVLFEPWDDGHVTWYVDDDAPEGGDGSLENPFQRIQDAVDNATQGDNIRVWEGIYYENVVVNKTVSLKGNGSVVTTIDGGREGDVVRITADCVNMSGFRIAGSQEYDGIKVESANNHIFMNNFSNSRNGILIDISSDCKIENNTCSSNLNNGIRLHSSSNCTLTNNTCENNNERGIYISDSSNCTLKNNNCSMNKYDGIGTINSSMFTIEKNSCYSNGIWGIYLWDLKNGMIKNNICFSNEDVGIYLLDVDDCTLMNNICENNDGGIYFDSPTNCTILNNVCENNNRHGMRLLSSSYCTLVNNTCKSNSQYGIYLGSSNDNTLTNNIVSNNSEYGICLLRSNNIILINNSAFNNDERGIYLGNSSNNTLTNNTVSDNEDGISLIRSNDNTLRNNAMSNNSNNFYISGKSQSHFNQTIDTSNSVDSKLIYYLVGNQSETIDIDALNIGILVCISSTDIVVRNATNLTKNGFGILFFDTNNSVIQNITTHTINIGIFLRSSHNNTITNNTFSDNEVGIYLENSNNNTITYNTATYNMYGIYLDSSNDNVFTNNILSDNINGIDLRSSSRDNNAHDNIIFDNIEFGINGIENNGFIIDASNNWWGTTSGPFHPSMNPGGEGDNITDYVEFDPWVGKEDNGNSKPTITVDNPINNSHVSGIVSLSGSVYDVDGIVTNVEIDITDFHRIGIALVNGITNWTGDWDTNYYPNGEYVLRIRCYDGVDYSEEITLTLIVENQDDSGSGNPIFIIGLIVIILLVIIIFFKRKIVIKQ